MDRVVLIGFMASGKSEVGWRLARKLGWRHYDLDEEIARTAGRSIARIFSEDGEVAFRKMEAEITPEFVRRERAVISTGGGWVTNAGLVEALPRESLLVYLKVSPGEVLKRLEADPNQPTRPLLAHSDPRRRIEELLAARETLYHRAKVVIDTDHRTPEEVAVLLQQIVLSGPPAPSPQDRIAQHGS